MSKKKHIKSGKALQTKKSLLEKISAFFEKYEKSLVVTSLTLCAIICILLFDVKVSLSGDDCDYIIAAEDFWKNFTYPGHHGPLYPIILSPFVGIFGINILLLKLLSTIFTIASIWLLYYSFRHIIPLIILIPSLFLVCINPYVLFFASYTYSEPLFLLLQSLFFYLFSKYFWKVSEDHSTKVDWKKYLFLTFVIMGIGLTRTIGFSVIGVIALYFIIERKWKDLIYLTGVFTVIFCVFYFLKPVIWPSSSTVQSFETLFAKNPYNPELGSEDFSGLITRIIDNSHIYLSTFLFKYFGFRSHSEVFLDDMPVVTVIMYILFIICFISVFRKSKPLMFIGLYVGALLLASFTLLHTIWGQDRMIMIYYPYILLFLTGGFYYIFNKNSLRKFSIFFPLIIISIFISTSEHTRKKISLNIPVLQQNILGNDLYGLTPDWENFIIMSRWVKDNIDEDVVVASRKPTISQVYTDRPFLGIYNVPFVAVNEVLDNYNKEKDNSTFMIIEYSSNKSMLDFINSYIKYTFSIKGESSFLINEKTVSTATVYKLDNSIITEDFIKLLNDNNFNFSFDIEAFLKQCLDDKEYQYQFMDPDVLLKNIKDSNIRYFILAKIRLYSYQNTGYYVNTIHQYLSVIQYKYPNLFRMVNSIGKDESCELVEYVGN